jgi:hypothetical protein
MLDRLANGRLGTPDELRRTLSHIQLSGRLSDTIYSMEATNTEFHAHQFKPVLKLLASPSAGLLIADEVGLGKMIEAGLIWTELRAQYDARRLLVLCPKSLCRKWQDELAEKFDVRAEIMDAATLEELLSGGDPRRRSFAVICGLQGARPPQGWDDPDENLETGAARLARRLRDLAEEAPIFDLLVIVCVETSPCSALPGPRPADPLGRARPGPRLVSLRLRSWTAFIATWRPASWCSGTAQQCSARPSTHTGPPSGPCLMTSETCTGATAAPRSWLPPTAASPSWSTAATSAWNASADRKSFSPSFDDVAAVLVEIVG